MTSIDFAEAQRRVKERRRLRASEAQARRQSRTSQQTLSASRRLPSPLSTWSQTAINTWDSIKGREGTRPAFRVGQVDAELLDEELLDLLKGQVNEALKYFDAHLQDDWTSEIEFALRALLFKLSIWDHNASYGASLQNLKYTDARYANPIPAAPSRWQKVLYGGFSVGGRYAWAKWENWLLDQQGTYDQPSTKVRVLSQLTSLTSNIHSVAAFASFLVFLINGRYRTILDRILRLRLAPPSSQMSRQVSFEYLNRQLVWHAFTEFLLFLLPLIGISRWRRWLSKAWRKTKGFITSGGEEDLEQKGELSFLPERTCAICYQDQNPTSTSESEILAISGASGGVIGSAQTDITNPYEMIPCGCKFCYVCAASKLEAEEGEGWTCLRCGELVKECKPWTGDVLEEVATLKNKKSVSFSDEDDKSTDNAK